MTTKTSEMYTMFQQAAAKAAEASATTTQGSKGYVPYSEQSRDGYINVYILDADGVPHSINKVIPISRDSKRPLDGALLDKLEEHQKELDAYHAAVAAGEAEGLVKPADPEFHFSGTVVLNTKKAPRF